MLLQTVSSPIQVAIVEDDPLLRRHLSDLVSTVEGFILAGSAGTLAEGRKFIHPGIDVLLIDLALPDGSGLDIILEARRSGPPQIKIIVITVFGDVENTIRAIEAGADGYLLKGVEVEQAETAIRNVLAGGAPISPSVAAHILARLRLRPSAAEPNLPDRDLIGGGQLTERERDVLTDLARGYSYKEVAKRQAISHHTVADHVKAIYRKLSVRSRSQAVFEAMQSGLIDLSR